jgi:hypothetical protein
MNRLNQIAALSPANRHYERIARNGGQVRSDLGCRTFRRDKKQETRSKKQETRGKRQEAREARDKRQEARGKKQEARDKRQETRGNPDGHREQLSPIYKLFDLDDKRHVHFVLCPVS